MKRYECKGQLSIFDIELPRVTMGDELRARGYTNVYDALPEYDCLCEMVDTHEYPKIHLREAHFNASSKTWDVGSYGWPLKWWKEISPKTPAEIWYEEVGTNDYWQNSNNIIFKDNKPICKHSGHTCNKKELFCQAMTLADESNEMPTCPHVCCRMCSAKDCAVRCNGAHEVRQWHRASKQLPEQSGFYEIMDVDGRRGRAWYEATIKGFNHVTNRAVECWREEYREKYGR